MATFAQTPQMAGATPPQPRSMQQATSGTEPTPDNPAQGTTEQRLDANGLTEDDKKNLLFVTRHYTEIWSLPRRITVSNTLRRLEYVKGNQYISFDPYSFNFYDPMDAYSGAGGLGTAGGLLGNDALGGEDIYQYVSNVVQWLLRVFVATLGTTLPATRFSPSDATSDLDNRTAENASKANALIERW